MGATVFNQLNLLLDISEFIATPVFVLIISRWCSKKKSQAGSDMSQAPMGRVKSDPEFLERRSYLIEYKEHYLIDTPIGSLATEALNKHVVILFIDIVLVLEPRFEP